MGVVQHFAPQKQQAGRSVVEIWTANSVPVAAAGDAPTAAAALAGTAGTIDGAVAPTSGTAAGSVPALATVQRRAGGTGDRRMTCDLGCPLASCSNSLQREGAGRQGLLLEQERAPPNNPLSSCGQSGIRYTCTFAGCKQQHLRQWRGSSTTTAHHRAMVRGKVKR